MLYVFSNLTCILSCHDKVGLLKKTLQSTIVNDMCPHTYCTCCASSNLCTSHVHCILLTCLYYTRMYAICYSVYSNNISDEGARAVADGMKYCTSLQTLR